MVLHQGVSIQMKGIFAFVLSEKGKISFEILFIQENSLPSIPPRDYMIKGGRKMDSRFACHRLRIAPFPKSVNTLLPLPDPRYDPRYLVDEQGNAHFVGDVGDLPAVCLTEPDIAFLVRTSSGAWIANGSVRKP